MTLEKKILVPLDVSVKTFRELQFVLKNAPLFNWSVFIIVPFENDQPDNKENVDQQLEGIIDQVKRDFPLVEVRGEAIQGSMLQVILDLNTSEHIDLVVSGQYADISHYTTRNIMEGLVEECYMPILVLPESKPIPDLHRIGVMTSFHEDEIESIKLVEQLFDGKLFITVFHIANEGEKDIALERMHEWELDVRGNIKKVDIDFLVIEANRVIDGVASAITEKGIDILVVTSIAETFVKRIISRNYFKEFAQSQLSQPTLFVRCD
ncbi:hypothetical protein RYH73_21545 [Olivibacter sp. CPCC 100613]|uniref:hypothetical protein n=1 Tax=Olivibacter sp. CPCC 100613 TaxID=3079931 RepID=UPI002FF72B0C